MVQSIEDYSLWNIFNQINLRRGQKERTSIRYITFPVFFAGQCIMFPCFSWEGLLLTSCPVEKNHVFGKNIQSFQIIQGRLCAGMAPPGKTIFSESLKKIPYFRVFFRKDHLSFSVKRRVRWYFREKEISFFPIMQERSYSSAIFLERPFFQDVRKKKIWFSVQW